MHIDPECLLQQRIYIGVRENTLVVAAYIEKPGGLKFITEEVQSAKFEVKDIAGEMADYQTGFIQQQPRRLVLQKDDAYAIFGFEDMHLDKKREVTLSEERGTPFYCTEANELLSSKTLEDKISVFKSGQGSAITELTEDAEGPFEDCLDLGACYIWDGAAQSLCLVANNIRMQSAEFKPDGTPLQNKPEYPSKYFLKPSVPKDIHIANEDVAELDLDKGSLICGFATSLDDPKVPIKQLGLQSYKIDDKEQQNAQITKGPLEEKCKERQYYYIAGYRGFESDGIIVFLLLNGLVKRPDRPLKLDFTSRETIAPEKVWKNLPVVQQKPLGQKLVQEEVAKSAPKSEPEPEPDVPQENVENVSHLCRFMAPFVEYSLDSVP